jgi:predicted ferric reductase
MNFSKFETHRGVVLLALLTMFPLIPWVFMRPLAVRFADSTVGLTSFSQLSALFGTVLLALTTLLFVSPRFSSRLFGGTQPLLQARRVSVVVATLLLLTHPVALAIKLIPYSTTDAARFLLPGSDWVFNFGIHALVLLLALYGIQFLSRRSGALRHVPLVLATALFFGTLHAFFIPSDLSHSVVLKTYVLGIVGVSLSECLRQLFITQKNPKESKVPAAVTNH